MKDEELINKLKIIQTICSGQEKINRNENNFSGLFNRQKIMATKKWFFRSVSRVAVDKVSLGGSSSCMRDEGEVAATEARSDVNVGLE